MAKKKGPRLTLADFERLYRETAEIVLEYGLSEKDHPFLAYWRRLIRETPDTFKSVFRVMSHPIATFSLLTGRSIDNQCTIHVPGSRDFKRDISTRPLLKPDFLVESETQLSCSKAGACRLPSSRYTGYLGSPERSKCEMIRHHQSHTRITLKPRNLTTLYEQKWLDSAVMDAWWYGLHKSFREADKLYIISAEQDPDLDFLRFTDGCYDYILIVLYFKEHWTCMFINHRCRELFYFNSQLSHKTAREQLRPFREKFPDYAVEIAKVPQQGDKFSCGVFVCWYAYCLLNCPELIQSLNSAHCSQMRHAILQQLITWYIL